MLKVIFMIDCNLCGSSFHRLGTSSDRDPLVWKGIATDLEYKAQKNEWTMYRSAHHCDYCVTDAMAAMHPAMNDTGSKFFSC